MSLDDDGSVIDRYYAAMTGGDVAGARACCTPDAVFWHSFDGLTQDLDTAARAWAAMAESLDEMGVGDVRRTRIGPDRYLNQQLFMARRKDGSRLAWAVCLLLQLREGRIARLDEYIDRAGVLQLGPGEPRTPGLEAA